MGRKIKSDKILQELSKVLSKIRRKYKKALLDKAVSIFTPFPERVPLSKLNLSPETIDFIQRYEPRVETEGLFRHQWELLDAYTRGYRNFILTSATGTGKSLCFWAWVIDHLVKNPDATALLCFPTQALMWSQAERLAKISKKSSLRIHNDVAYSGTLKLGKKEIRWTVWYGKKKDEYMQEHEDTQEFRESNIRIATLDKAHYSLIGQHVDFTKNLECLVLDEAHLYDGIFGANVLYFIKRLYIAKELAGKEKPNVFLASATLSDAEPFASKLLSLDKKEIYHQTDAVKPKIEVISLDEAKSLLENPPRDGLLRVLIFLDSLEQEHSLEKLLKDNIFGNQINVVYFSENKFYSRLLKYDLDSQGTNKRKVVIYDADLPPKERRHIESKFNRGKMQGATLIATSALELGVDIENLDVCLIDIIPPKPIELIQRIGRVGRRIGRPGLIILKLSANPFDRFIAKKPHSAFRFDMSRSIPIPSDIEMVRLRHMAAAHSECRYEKYAVRDWNYFIRDWNYLKKIFEKHFGVFLNMDEIKQILKERYTGLVDITEEYWTHKGFRASASEGKIPLKNIENGEEIALIDVINIFRDAHPEAIYLDANGQRWRVKEYEGRWKEAEWEHPDSKIILAKFLKSIEFVYVEKVEKKIATRGIWEEKFDPYQIFDKLPEDVSLPVQGKIEYGIWEYSRSFKGYQEIYLPTKTSFVVPVEKVTERFKRAIEKGKRFPFLFPLSYRTYGWEWNFNKLIEEIQSIRDIEDLVKNILEHYMAYVVQSKFTDLIINLSLSEGYLRVLDSTPGGNGLSEALLKRNRVPEAFSVCLEDLEQYKNPEGFKLYVYKLCGAEVEEKPKYGAEEVIKIVKKLKSYWCG